MNNDLISREGLLKEINDAMDSDGSRPDNKTISQTPIRRGRGGNGEVQRLYLCPRKIWAPQMRTWHIHQQHME